MLDIARSYPSPRAQLSPLSVYTMLLLAYCAGLRRSEVARLDLGDVDLQGGTITITNIGVFGMDAGTPIINPGESGIVAMGTIRQKPWVVDGEVRPRYVTTVSGSFDHRVIDGDGMSRFIADVASILEEPALLLD